MLNKRKSIKKIYKKGVSKHLVLDLPSKKRIKEEKHNALTQTMICALLLANT